MYWKTGISPLLMAAIAAIPLVAAPQEVAEKRDQIKRHLNVIREEQAEVSKSLLELIEKHGTLVMSREKVLNDMGQLEEQAWNSKLARKELTIRSEVLRARLKKMIEEATEAEKEDEIATLLDKKLAIANSKKNRVDVGVKGGTISTSEVEEADSLVTDAQLALAQHRESKKQSAEAEEIKSITREIAEMESDVIVKEKLADFQLKRMDELKGSLLKTAEYTDLERTEASLSRRREHWEELLLHLDSDESAFAESKNAKEAKDKKDNDKEE